MPDGGFPGALPTICEAAVQQAARAGLALGGQINEWSRFDRKHYFYPDLPSGYQITQQFHPIVVGGSIPLTAEEIFLTDEDCRPQFLAEIAASKVEDHQTPPIGSRKQRRREEHQQRTSAGRKRLTNLGVTLTTDFLASQGWKSGDPPNHSPQDPPSSSLFERMIKQHMSKRIRIAKMHVEHDSGKSLHNYHPTQSCIDLNRAGTALIEIVSEPDINSSLEAVLYVKKLQTLLQLVEASEAELERGSMRCDVNISVRPMGEQQFGTRVEIKNLNSPKSMRSAIDYEIERQIALITTGKVVEQETRQFDVLNGTTYRLRSKQSAIDYRFFPDPDLPVLHFSKELQEASKLSIPRLPDEWRDIYVNKLALPIELAVTIIQEPSGTLFFEELLHDSSGSRKRDPNQAAQWMVSELLGLLRNDNLTLASSPVKPRQVASILDLIDDDLISGKIGKQILAEMYSASPQGSPVRLAAEIVEAKGWGMVSDSDTIRQWARETVQANLDEVLQYKAGNARVFKLLMGHMMKVSQGKASPVLAEKILQNEIDQLKQ